MNFFEWQDYGIAQGWISQPVCVTHEWFELTDEEEKYFDEDGEVCIFASRYNSEGV